MIAIKNLLKRLGYIKIKTTNLNIFFSILFFTTKLFFTPFPHKSFLLHAVTSHESGEPIDFGLE